MHRRPGDAETQTQRVIHGLQGRPAAEPCQEPQMSPALAEPWRDQCLATASRAFAVPPCHRQEARLARAHARLNVLVGDSPAREKHATSGGAAAAALGPDAGAGGSLLSRSQALKAEHPCRGDRRRGATLPCGAQRPIPTPRGRRGRREHHLLVKPPRQRKATRAPGRSPPGMGGSDRTKGLAEGGGSSVLVVAWSTTQSGGD